jgi:SAM-dependent methyltransferase
MNPSKHPSACSVCGNEAFQPLFAGRDKNQGAVPGTFTVARCTRCGLVQTTPPPDAAVRAAMYPVQYYPALIDRTAPHPFQQDKIDLVRTHKPAGRLLDVGAGVGLFVWEARKSGYDVKGIEFSAQAVETGLRNGESSIICGDFLRAEEPASSVDIVTLWHVIEHLDSPVDVLRKIHQILKPGGIVIITVPNIDSLQARVFRGRWYHLDVPRHLFHYSPATLGALLENAGFRVAETKFGWREHDPAGFLGSLMLLSPPGEGFIHKAVRKLAGMPIARFCAWLEATLHRGGTFAIVATKH